MEDSGTEEKEMATPEEIKKIIRNHSLGSMAVGLIPLPLVDLVALTGVQLNMLSRLAKCYGVPFMKNKARSLIGALVGGVVPVSFAGATISLAKTVPLVGQATGALAMPAMAGAATYAVGKVFAMHFASGGTLLNFDPEQMKDYYAQMFEEGKEAA